MPRRYLIDMANKRSDGNSVFTDMETGARVICKPSLFPPGTIIEAQGGGGGSASLAGFYKINPVDIQTGLA